MYVDREYFPIARLIPLTQLHDILMYVYAAGEARASATYTWLLVAMVTVGMALQLLS